MGSHIIRENRERAVNDETTKSEVLDLLKKNIRPEFLNRIDEIIMFIPLDETEIKQIVQLQLNGVKKHLTENGVDLQFTDAAVSLISEEGYDPQFGARPVKRVIQRQVLNPLSKDILAGKINHSQPIIIDATGGELVFKN
jgi:ATP-dependent Clp protease ATP-binding subunit ClpB